MEMDGAIHVMKYHMIFVMTTLGDPFKLPLTSFFVILAIRGKYWYCITATRTASDGDWVRRSTRPVKSTRKKRGTVAGNGGAAGCWLRQIRNNALGEGKEKERRSGSWR